MIVFAEDVGVRPHNVIERTRQDSLVEPAQVLRVGLEHGRIAANDRAAILVLFDFEARSLGDHPDFEFALSVHVLVTSSYGFPLRWQSRSISLDLSIHSTTKALISRPVASAAS